tara:strand:+ start:6600 stop:7541 length:942 start_codon:yes stop_codon:yes gene_type:complete
MGLIDLRGVKKRFGRKVILEGVDLDIREKDIFGIIGVNGSGKTTLLKLLIGFYKTSHGKVSYKGKNISRIVKKVHREFGFTSQESSFYPKLTVKENLFYFGSLYGLHNDEIRTNMDKVLKLVELDDVKKVLAENLSGGMQRRLDLACSMIHEPKVLVLDEPTEDLDPLLRREIIKVIKKINKLGTTVIITSHLLDDIESLCNRVAILHHRKVMKVGSIDDLRKLYDREEEIHLEVESGKYERIIKFAKLKDVECVGSKLIVYTKDAEKTLHLIFHIIENDNEKLVYADVKKPNLEEIFESLTKEGESSVVKKW